MESFKAKQSKKNSHKSNSVNKKNNPIITHPKPILHKSPLIPVVKEQIKTKINNEVKINKGTDTMINRYKACMILSAVGDAMGYKNGDW